MKNVVTLDEIREVEVRPQAVYDRYLQLLEADVPNLLAASTEAERTECPACTSNSYRDQFAKLGFRYRSCDRCGTMFVAERPTDDAIQDYYARAESHRYFVEEYLSGLQGSEGARLLTRRIDWILDSMAEYSCPKNAYLDQRSKYAVLLERMRADGGFGRHHTARALFPGAAPQGYVDGGPIRTYADASLSVITAFEFLDSLYMPELFGRDTFRTLEPGGLLFVTTRSISGFDMQVLWSESRSILPPNHVTLFSVEGLVAFFERFGFVVRELSTPGQLDLDIVANSLARQPAAARQVGGIENFVSYLLNQRDREAHQSFKEFLQRNRLSSHARLVLQKPATKEDSRP